MGTGTDAEGAGPLVVGSPAWRTARGALTLERPRVMGVLNVTPDSFWEESRVESAEGVLARAERFLDEGADLLDVGGESTRPGAVPVSEEEELRRVVPVVAAIVRRWPDALVSVDTVKATVAHAAIGEGAAVVNDVSGLRLDARLGSEVARHGAGLVLMHSRGPLERLASYDLATYGEDPVSEIAGELGEALERALECGVAREAVVLDPGLGFGKRTEHSVAALARLGELGRFGRPLMIGPSRKRFIGDILGGLPAEERLEGTIAACVAGLLSGARIFRVHDVRAIRRALDATEEIRLASD